MSWGYKIVIVFVLFVSGILFLVVKASRQEQEMVTTNYYEKELVYQDQIDAMESAVKLSSDITAVYSNNLVQVFLPEEMKDKTVNAHLWLYCPSNSVNDREGNVRSTNGYLGFNAPALPAGNYYVKVSWNADGVSYYSEKQLIIK